MYTINCDTSPDKEIFDDIKKLLYIAFPQSEINIYDENKISITENQNKSYIVLLNDIIFRSKCGQGIKNTIYGANKFFQTHILRDNKWYLPPDPHIYSPKNREFDIKFEILHIPNQTYFYQTFPPFDYPLDFQRDNINAGNILIHKNKMKICNFRELLYSTLKERLINTMSTFFYGNVVINQDYLLTHKEGIGYHICDMLIQIIKFKLYL